MQTAHRYLARPIWACVTLICILILTAPAGALPPAELAATELPDPQELLLGAPADVDKLHNGDGGWAVNYFNDLDADGDHDPGEPFGDSSQPGWSNPVAKFDYSCWMASGCNLLEQIGKVPDGQALYEQYARDGVNVNGSLYTWDEGGRQEFVVMDWMDAHPAEAADMELRVHFFQPSVGYTDGMFAWEDWDPRQGTADYLAAGWSVGVGIFVLDYTEEEGGSHSGGHALTMQAIDASTFDCTDSDRDADYSNIGDVNTYADGTRGPDEYLEHTYYGWYSEYYDGSVETYPVADVGFVVAVIPEPGTLALLAVGAAGILRRRRR
ncbi:MAG: PEP-CTERM sorting domain-containing protein [Phycisphaerae bacterium]